MVTLAYHQIDDRWDFSWNMVPAGRFRKQMEFLRDLGMEGTPFADRDDPGHVAITFDDALDGVMNHAFPILESLGFRATVFVPTGWVGLMNSWDSRLVGRRASHMDWDDLRRLSDAGWEVASHGVRHLDLTSLGDERLEEELNDSREAIRRGVGVTPESLSWPFGRCDDRVAAAARLAGYRRACVSYPAPDTDDLRIGRTCVRRFDSIPDVRAKLCGGSLAWWQVWKDRFAHFCCQGTPRFTQRKERAA